MDLWNRQEAVSVDLTKRSEDQRHEAVNQQECRIGEPRLVVVVAAPAANLRPVVRADKGKA
jgi:hypothetical protein